MIYVNIRRTNKIAHIKGVIERLCDNTSKSVDSLDAISTSFRLIDESIGGFFPGEFVVVGGRPAMGKTTFVLNMATKGAIDGVPVAYLCPQKVSLLTWPTYLY